MDEIIDPHNNEGKWENWKKEGMKIGGISEGNRELIISYLNDMERGKNINGNSKGCRSCIRLNVLRVRLPQIARFFEQEYKKDLDKITRDMATEFGFKLKKGEFKRVDGKPYKHKVDFIKDLKAFWHWHMKIQARKYHDSKETEGSMIEDVTEDLARDKEKPPEFVYFTINELDQMMKDADFKYRVLMKFLFDSIIRAPKELANVRVKDLEEGKDGIYTLDIREETSKTYGRKIKLLLSSKMVKSWIETNKLKPEDYLFKICPSVANKVLKRLGKKSINKMPTMYDFRHSGACYWTTRYKHETALRYRGGWKDSQRLDYYTTFLGMKDTITKDDLEDSETRTELQKKIEDVANDKALLSEKLTRIEEDRNKEIEKLKKRLAQFEENFEIMEKFKDIVNSKAIAEIMQRNG